MTRPWTTLERVATRAGELALRRRGDRDFLLTLDGRVLMTSAANDSERALAEWACADLAVRRPRLLLGGLGMGYTLRAALDALPGDARICVAEIEPAVIAWCRGPLAVLTDGAVLDRRVDLRAADVMEPVREAARGDRPRFDAIAVDLFEGPRGTRDEEEHPLYGGGALASIRAALADPGVFAVWSEAPAPGFVRRLVREGFRVETRRAGRGGRRHALYRARLGRQARGPAGRRTERDPAFHSRGRRR